MQAARGTPLTSTQSFGYPGDGGLGDRLIAAVVSGAKTATSSLAVEYSRGEPMPRAGQRLALVDHAGVRYGTVRTTAVTTLALSEVGDDVAHAEGEGYADAEAWRRGHVRYWADVTHLIRSEIDDPTWQLSPDEPVVVHWFELDPAADRPGIAAV